MRVNPGLRTRGKRLTYSLRNPRACADPDRKRQTLAMTALAALQDTAFPDAADPIDDAWGEDALLDHLRQVTLRCRSAARADLFEACALLALHRDAARAAYVEALVRCLPQALGNRPVVLRPGETARSFDESWLMRLVATSRNGDGDSFDFLIRARVVPHARRNLSFLIHRIAHLYNADPAP